MDLQTAKPSSFPRDDRDILHAAFLLRAAFNNAHLPCIVESILDFADYFPRLVARRVAPEQAGRNSHLKLYIPPELCFSSTPVRGLSLRLSHPEAKTPCKWISDDYIDRKDRGTHDSYVYWMQKWQLEKHTTASENEGPNNWRNGGWNTMMTDPACPNVLHARSSQSTAPRPPGGPFDLHDSFYPGESDNGRHVYGTFIQSLTPGSWVALQCYYHNHFNFDVWRTEKGWVSFAELTLFLESRVDFDRMVIRQVPAYVMPKLELA